MALYLLTIFLGAFLVFLVQPYMGKYILPWFGGGSGVWTACMLFFQGALLAGYAYAHALRVFLSPRRQLVVHTVLLVAALAFLPVLPSGQTWKPLDSDMPTGRILALLAATIGVPFLLLAATAPLVQSWFARVYPDRSPYRLYALSNAGSLLALIGYPFIIERVLRLRQQGWIWSGLFVIFAAACVWAAWRFARSTRGQAGAAGRGDVNDKTAAAPTIANQFLWLLLAATGSLMLLAVTNRMCQDLSVEPRLWVMPLAIYLLTFIIAFERDKWYRRIVLVPLMGASCLLIVYVMRNPDMFIAMQITILALLLLSVCMVCHGELARLRPAPAFLTRYYLMIAAGGALGGAAVALGAPMVFTDYWELPIGMVGSCILAGVCIARSSSSDGAAPKRRLPLAAASVIFAGVLAVMLGQYGVARDKRVIDKSRNFYGVVRVENVDFGGLPALRMAHGATLHGVQFTDARHHNLPTSYYGAHSGVGIAMRFYTPQAGAGAANQSDARQIGARQIGVVGLGTGTIAALARPGDRMQFFEIDPAVHDMAVKHFTFMRHSKGDVSVSIGDGRILLEAQARPLFDILVLDAFSSDAVPLHLLTREAMRVYLSRLKPDGILAFHLSNRFADPAPAVLGLAIDAGYAAARITSHGDMEQMGTQTADWVLVTNNRAFLEVPAVRAAITPWADHVEPILWTDDYASLWSVLRDTVLDDKWAEAPNFGRFVVDVAEVMDFADRVAIEDEARVLYHRAGGGRAMMAITVPSRRALGFGDFPMPRFAQEMAMRLGMAAPGLNIGATLVVSVKDRQAHFHVTSSAPEAVKARLAALSEELASSFDDQSLSGEVGRVMQAAAELLED